MVDGGASAGQRVRLTDRISIGVLTRLFPRDLVDEVIAHAGRKEKRSRLLPAHVVVYYVLALALYFGEAYEEVIRRLVGGLRFLRNWSGEWKVPTTSAISQARARLGAAPMEALFRRVAVPIARPGSRGAWFRSWRVMAIDGVILDVPDTPENNAEFEHSKSGRGESAFPMVRLVGLGECGTHAIVSAALGTVSVGEQTLVPQLLPEVTPDMLILADRGFYSYKLYQAIIEIGAAVVFRATAKLVLPVLEVYPDGSYRSVVLDSATSGSVRKRAKRAGTDEHRVLAAAGAARVSDGLCTRSTMSWMEYTGDCDG
ncbi:MAG: IS4 family transposase [Labedaea sp.]